MTSLPFYSSTKKETNAIKTTTRGINADMNVRNCGGDVIKKRVGGMMTSQIEVDDDACEIKLQTIDDDDVIMPPVWW